MDSQKFFISFLISYLWVYRVFAPFSGDIAEIRHGRNRYSWVYRPLCCSLLGFGLYGRWQFLPGFLIVWAVNTAFEFLFQEDHSFIRSPLPRFITEMVLEVAVLLAVSQFLPPGNTFWDIRLGSEYYGMLFLLAGWIFSGWWCGDLIGLVLRSYHPGDYNGLPSGGKVIGLLERSILYLLLLLNAPTSVGFLITAKTLFRFGEITTAGNNRQQVEYILIGTFLSFFIGILCAVLAMLFAQPFMPAHSFKILP